MADNLLTIIKECLIEVTERPIEEITEDMRLDDHFDLDSVMFVQFLLALEDRVPNLQFAPEAISEAAFNDIRTLKAFLQRTTAQAA
jgi:acyl carrier protein